MKTHTECSIINEGIQFYKKKGNDIVKKANDVRGEHVIGTSEFCNLSVQMVQKACEKYWLEKDSVLFFENLICDEVPVVGLDSADEDGVYKIEEQEYQSFLLQENMCVVTGKMVVYDTNKVFTFQEDVNVMINCMKKDSAIYFSGIHMSIKKKKVLSMDERKSPSFYYKKLMGSMCDILLETKADEDYFIVDEEKYYALFGDRPKFQNMDQWFWHICQNCVLKQDLEKLDLFRDNDLAKRLENDDLIIETTFRIQRGACDIVWVHMRIVFVLDITGKSIGNIFVMLTDCTKEMNEKMNNLEFARTDYLTHTWNRRYTEELIEERIEKFREGIFVLFDVDKFKTVNDSYGHITGDDLLVKISANVKEKLQEDDVFGRLGGDEFVVYLKRSGDEEVDKKRVLDVFRTTKFHYKEKDVEMDIHCSAGVVFFVDRTMTFDKLYERADKAMYEAKSAGRDTIVIG